MKGDRPHLEHIFNCISKINRYTVSGRDEFLSPELIQDAALPALKTMAESTQRLSDAVKPCHPEIDWRALSRFRTVIAHDDLGMGWRRCFERLRSNCPS